MTWWRDNPVVEDAIDPTDLCYVCGVSRDRHPRPGGCGGGNYVYCTLPPGFFWDELSPWPTTAEGFEAYYEKPFSTPQARVDANGDYQWWVEEVPNGYAERTAQDVYALFKNLQAEEFDPNVDPDRRDLWPT